MIPLRLQCLRALTTLIESTETGTWEDDTPIDLAGKVQRGRKVFSDSDFEENEDTLISILEAPRPLVGLYAGVEQTARKESWQLLLQGWTKDDKLHPSDPAYFLQSAVEQRVSRAAQRDDQGLPVFPDDYRLGGLAYELILGQGIVRPAEGDPSRYTMFYVPLTIVLALETSKPYQPLS